MPSRPERKAPPSGQGAPCGFRDPHLQRLRHLHPAQGRAHVRRHLWHLHGNSTRRHPLLLTWGSCSGNRRPNVISAAACSRGGRAPAGGGRPRTRALPAARLLGASLGGFAHLNRTVSWAHLLSLSFPVAIPAHLGPLPLDPDSVSLISWATRPAVTAQNCAGRVHFPQSRSLAFTWIIWFHLVPSSDSMGVSPGTRFSNASEPLTPPTRGPS